MNNKYLIKNLNDENFKFYNLQYREAILDILEKNNKINTIVIDEKIPGEISIVKLVEKINNFNNKINVIFFLNKEDINKINKLKKLGVKNIYINKRNNVSKIINNLYKENNSLEKNAKVIAVDGDAKSGKTTITELMINYLNNKNKKVGLINLNQKIKKSKNINEKNKINFDESINNNEIKSNIIYIKIINKNIIENVENNLKKYKEVCDYIIVDISNRNNKYIKNKIIKNCDINVFIINSNNIEEKQIKEINKKDIKKSYIIYNKYNLFSINKKIIKNIINKNFKFVTIPYSKKIYHKYYANNVHKVDFFIKKEMKKILEC